MGIARTPLSLNEKSKKISKLSPADYDLYLIATRTQTAREASLDPDDWKIRLHPGSRQRLIHKIMERLNGPDPSSSLEGLYLLERSEEEAYAAATSKFDYVEKLVLKIKSIKPHSLSSNNAGTSTRLSNSAQTGHADWGDWQEEVYQKIRAIKEMYLPEIIEIYDKIATKLTRLQKHDSHPQQPNSQKLKKLKIDKARLQCVVAFLEISKDDISLGSKRKLDSYAELIISSVDLYRHTKSVCSLQQGQLSKEISPCHPLPSNNDNTINTRPDSDSTAQTGHANGGDWQEEIYQKIRTVKEMYLPELNEMYQKIVTKLQKHNSRPQQTESEKLGKLIINKIKLEDILAFLQVSKDDISLGFKQNLGSYEELIINSVNIFRQKKSASSLQQGQLPTENFPVYSLPSN